MTGCHSKLKMLILLSCLVSDRKLNLTSDLISEYLNPIKPKQKTHNFKTIFQRLKKSVHCSTIDGPKSKFLILK